MMTFSRQQQQQHQGPATWNARRWLAFGLRGLLWSLALALFLPMPLAQGAAQGTGQPFIDPGGGSEHWVAARKKRKRRRGKKKRKKADLQPEEPAEPALPEPPALGVKAAEGQTAPQAQVKVVALLPIIGIDVTEEMLRNIEIALLREIDQMEGMVSVTPEDVVADLEQYAHPEITVDCSGKTECIANAGRYARAHLAVETRVAALGGSLSTSIRIVDTVEKKEVGRAADPISEDNQERAPELHRLVVQALRPDTYIGTLKIDCPTQDAEAYLDDKLIGTTPLEKPLTGLRAGPHILRISKPGYSDLYRFVDVVYKRSSTISIDLETNTISGLIVELESETGYGLVYLVGTEAAAGVELRIDGEPMAQTPLAGPLEKIPAGKRKISVHIVGQEAVTIEVDLEVDKRLDLGVDLGPEGLTLKELGTNDPQEPLPTQAVPEEIVAVAPIDNTPPPVADGPQMRSGPPMSITGIIVGSVGVASLGASGVFGAQIVRQEKEAEAQAQYYVDDVRDGKNPDRAATEAKLQEMNALGEKFELAHRVTLGAGVVLAAVGGYLLFDNIFGGDDEPTTSVESQVPATDAPSEDTAPADAAPLPKVPEAEPAPSGYLFPMLGPDGSIGIGLGLQF